MSTLRINRDLTELQWLVDLLGKINHAEGPASEEAEALKGVDNLVGRLRRQEVRPSNMTKLAVFVVPGCAWSEI